MSPARSGRERLRRSALLTLTATGIAAVTFSAIGLAGGRHDEVATIDAGLARAASHRGLPGKRGEPTAGRAGTEHDEIAARDVWFFHQRAYPSAVTLPGALAQATKHTLALRRSSLDRTATTLTWSQIGPNPIATIGADANYNSGKYGGAPPFAGRVSAIAPDLTNSSIVYLGGANGGVWKSTDGGASWASIWPSGMPSFSIGSIAINPGNHLDIWVGTGEANGTGDTYYGQGIWHSLDGGSSWTKVGGRLFNGCFIADLAVVNATTVNAAVLEFPGVENPSCTIARRGVWRTTSTGSTWTKASLPGSAYKAPSDFTQPAGAPGTIYLATYVDGVWRSTNAGATWTKIINTTHSFREAVSARSKGIVYLALSDSAGMGFGGLYKISTATARPVVKTIAPAATSNSPCTYPARSGGQCGYDLTVASDPTNTSRVFVGGIRVYRYTGTTGVPIGYGGTPGKIHVDQHVTVFDAAHNLWEGSDGGAYRLPSAQLGAAGPAFTNRNGSGSTALGITEFNGSTSGSMAAGTFLGGTQDNGTVKYTAAAGMNWRMDHGGDGGASAYINPSTYFASYYGNALFRTTSSGSCGSSSCIAYRQIFSTSGSEPGEFYPPLEQDRSNPTTLYRGTNRIWRTTNATTSTPAWSVISPTFTGEVSAIGVQAAASPAYVYAGVDAGSSTPTELEYTHNATAATPTWTVGAGPPNRYITDIWVNPANAADAIVTLSGFGTGHVWKTTNGGASWTSISAALPNVPVNAVDVDPANLNKVFLGTDTGVFWTSDGTAASPTWANTSSGLPDTTVTDIRVDGSYLVAATHGRGAWRAVKP